MLESACSKSSLATLVWKSLDPVATFSAITSFSSANSHAGCESYPVSLLNYWAGQCQVVRVTAPRTTWNRWDGVFVILTPENYEATSNSAESNCRDVTA